ncbi:MAG: hypothetical protein PHT12_04950 [Patescibacteria group bacterium]|nr:hypothetical protein [Patescibacteria group bacterium]
MTPANRQPGISGADFDLVIGLTGLKAAGKDVFVELARGHGFETIRTSDVIRAVLRDRGVEQPSVIQLQDEGDRGRRESGDGAYWQKIMLETARRQGWRRLICNGVRNPVEPLALELLLGDRYVLVGIVAPIDIRAQRFLKRGQAGDPAELWEFLKVDDRDRGIGQPMHGQQVDRTLALVEPANLYNNAGTLEDYRAWIGGRILALLG